MDHLRPIGHLRALRDELRRGIVSPEVARRAAGAIDDYLEHASEGLTLDAAFGVAPQRGGLPWWEQEALDARNAAIRAYASQLECGASAEELAAVIARALTRYRDGRWRDDEAKSEMPDKYRGTPSEYLWRAMKSAPRGAPTSEKQVRRILGHSIGD